MQIKTTTLTAIIIGAALAIVCAKDRHLQRHTDQRLAESEGRVAACRDL